MPGNGERKDQEPRRSPTDHEEHQWARILPSQPYAWLYAVP
jgi:hypothetical protein